MNNLTLCLAKSFYIFPNDSKWRNFASSAFSALNGRSKRFKKIVFMYVITTISMALNNCDYLFHNQVGYFESAIAIVVVITSTKLDVSVNDLLYQ